MRLRIGVIGKTARQGKRIASAAAGVLCALLLGSTAQAQAPSSNAGARFETEAQQALLFDYDTGTVLFALNAEHKIVPGSLVKLMTATLAFRELSEGRLKMDANLTVSADAWRRGGAVSGGPNMLLTPNKVLKVNELLTGLAVGNANDAALTLAEAMGGKEAVFVEQMNAHARELGLNALEFRNATGMAAEGQSANLQDLVRLSAHIIRTYPDFYPLFGQKDFPLGRGRQANRNPLIGLDIGADGLMTSHTKEGGHAIIASTVQEGRRLIVALAGLETLQERIVESRKLLDWGYRRFDIRTLFTAGERIGDVSIYGGEVGTVDVVSPGDIRLPVLRSSTAPATLRVTYKGPVVAPIAAGQKVAQLEVVVEGRVIQIAPLHAAKAVAKGSTLARAQDAAGEVMRRGARDGLRWLWEKAFSKPPQKPEAPAGAKS